MIRVLLVDDQPLVRTGVRALLERDEGIEVVAESQNGREALVDIDRHRPDVVLLDLQMPVMDGLAVLRELERRGGPASGRSANAHVDTSTDHGVRVVVLTTFGEDDNVFTALRLGASGFLLKDAGPRQLRDAVRTVAAGDALLSPGVTRRVMSASPTPRSPPGAPPGWTCSPAGSATCSPWSDAVCRTRRSVPRST